MEIEILIILLWSLLVGILTWLTWFAQENRVTDQIKEIVSLTESSGSQTGSSQSYFTARGSSLADSSDMFSSEISSDDEDDEILQENRVTAKSRRS